MVSTRRPTVASRSLADDLRPVLELHRSIQDRAYIRVDAELACQRIHSGRTAFDAESLLESAGDLSMPFAETASAMELSGLLSSSEAWALEERNLDVTSLVLAWANGESLPTDPTLRLARSVAAVLGNALLSGVSREIMQGVRRGSWTRSLCPCCGAAPDIGFTTEVRRYLVCWRCDAAWITGRRGCLSCGATTPPTLVRIPSPYLGYELAICNACGRYLKERRGGFTHEVLVERTLTAGLDDAARLRGLRT